MPHGFPQLLFTLLLVTAGCKTKTPFNPAESAKATGGKSFKEFTPVISETGVRRTWARVKNAGELRVLIHQQKADGLPRPGSVVAEEQMQVALVAEELGLNLRFVVVEERSGLIPMLLEGRADVIVAQLTVTPEREEQVSFTIPVRHVKEVTVVSSNAKDYPKSVEELAGKKVWVRASSSFAHTLKEVSQRLPQPVEIIPVPENLDTDEVLFRVAQGEYPITVADSDALSRYEQYRHDVKLAFVVKDKVPIAWAIHPKAQGILEAVNGVLFRHELSKHTYRVYGGDLPAIKKRKVLRVVMPNNSSSYMIYRGQQIGFQFEMAERLARHLGVRLEPVIPDRQKDMIQLLNENRADIIAAVLTVNEQRKRDVQFSRPFMHVDEILVQPAGRPPITKPEQMAGRQVHVRKSSSYWTTLLDLKAQVPTLNLVEAPAEMETEDIIEQVGMGEIPLTVADSNILEVVLTYRDDVQGSLKLGEKKILAYAVRKNTPKLAEAVNEFVKKEYRGVFYNTFYQKYFKNSRKIFAIEQGKVATSGMISPYDDLARKYGLKYRIDWRLIVAQMYQESRFDPKAESWVGAKGLLQLMPATAKEMGIKTGSIENPEANIAGGVKYLRKMLDRFDRSIPMRQRIRFALASYNAGYGHVIDAQRLAKMRGLDPNKWFGNVSEAILLLERPAFARKARYGYCRGSEPHEYVSNIQTKYDAFTSVLPAHGK